jgi:hypothetical protein
MLIFVMFPNILNFHPQPKKLAIAGCGPHQLMVNTRQSSEKKPAGMAVTSFNCPKQLCQKFEINILILLRTVAK